MISGGGQFCITGAGITEVQVLEDVMADGARLELEVLSEVLEVGGFGGFGFRV